MRELICTLTFLLLCFSLTSAAQQTNGDSKTKEMQSGAKMNEGQDISVDLMEAMNECNETFRTDTSYIQALNDSGSFPDETDRTPKCFVRCVLEKVGVASEEGMLDPKMAGMVFAGERGGKVMNDLEDLAKSCAMRDEKCKCERAYQFMKCFMEKEIEEYEKAA